MTLKHPFLKQGTWRVGNGTTIPLTHPTWFKPKPNAPPLLLNQLSYVYAHSS